MKEKKLYNFNILLIIIGVLTILKSLSLKIFYGQDMLSIPFNIWIWTHIIICSICLIAIIYHLYLHWGGIKNWIKRIKGLNAKMNTALVYISLFTFVSGVIAFFSFLSGAGHNAIGGIHGKFGLILVLLFILHTLKRLKWFRGRKKEKAFIPVVDHEKCIKCKKCINKCPAEVFAMENKKVVVKYENYCIQCKKCVHICPKKAIS